jgi:hypothetical protein
VNLISTSWVLDAAHLVNGASGLLNKVTVISRQVELIVGSPCRSARAVHICRRRRRRRRRRLVSPSAVTRVPAIHLSGAIGAQGCREPDNGRAVLLPLKLLAGTVMRAVGGLAGSQCCERPPDDGADQAQQARYERSSHGSRLAMAEGKTLDWSDVRNRGETRQRRE